MNMGRGILLLFLFCGLHMVYAGGKNSTYCMKSGVSKKLMKELSPMYIHVFYN